MIIKHSFEAHIGTVKVTLDVDNEFKVNLPRYVLDILDELTETERTDLAIEAATKAAESVRDAAFATAYLAFARRTASPVARRKRSIIARIFGGPST